MSRRSWTLYTRAAEQADSSRQRELLLKLAREWIEAAAALGATPPVGARFLSEWSPAGAEARTLTSDPLSRSVRYVPLLTEDVHPVPADKPPSGAAAASDFSVEAPCEDSD